MQTFPTLRARWRSRHRFGAFLIVSGVGLLFGLVILLPILPWVMNIVTDVKHVYITDLPEENRGTYLITDNGVMQLYAWYVEPEDFPEDAPTLDATSIQSFGIVEKEFDTLDKYQLYNVTTSERVGLTMVQTNKMQLILKAGHLEPGDYTLVVPTDSMFGGYTWQYFTLR